MERKTIHRCFAVWNFEKEERWLNSMAQSGWVLDGVGFCTYHFIACKPGAYTVRLEMHGPDEAYIDFMRETGAEYIGRVFQWIFFRKKSGGRGVRSVFGPRFPDRASCKDRQDACRRRRRESPDRA